MVEINNENFISKVLKCEENITIKNSVFSEDTNIYISKNDIEINIIDSIMDNILITITNDILTEQTVCQYLNKIFKFKNTIPINSYINDEVLVLYKTKYVKGFNIMGCKFDAKVNSFYIDS